MTTEDKIKLLIMGKTVTVHDHELKEVRNMLRFIKNNCTICLTQIKEKLQTKKS